MKPNKRINKTAAFIEKYGKSEQDKLEIQRFIQDVQWRTMLLSVIPVTGCLLVNILILLTRG